MKNKVFNLISLAIIWTLAAMPISALDQPFMKAAKNDLNKAYNSLKRATPDKGGHRENAMSLVNRAITAVNNGIEYDKRNPNNRPRRNDANPFENEFAPVSDQPNMQQAKAHLQNALNNLEKATADKGGYRVEAMRLVREAIAETQKGIEYDRRN
jgi:hypothetical protein